MRTIAAAFFVTLAATAVHAGEPQVIVKEAMFPEGPMMKEGTLYFAEYGGHRVSTWDGKETKVFWEQAGCGPSAIVELGGDFAVTCYDSGQMAVVSPDGKTVSVHDKDEAGGPLVGPNDATPDGKGGIYFTASGPWEPGPIVGRVLHMTADGKIAEAANDLHYANGIVMSSDGSRLFVNESEASRVISFKIEAGGSLSDRRVFARIDVLSEKLGAYPDGTKIGPDGNFYVGQYSAGTILVVDPNGKLLRKLDVPSPAAPNLTFSWDGKTVYVMAVDDTANAPYKGKVYAIPNE